MPSGSRKGQRKGGQMECKVCTHPGKAEIDAMIINGVKYPVIIRRMKEVHPGAPELIPSNLSNHKHNHLLNNPITVVGEDGEKQTYITGAYPAPLPAIPDEPATIPSLENALSQIIGIGLHNMRNNPALVTPKDVLAAIDALRKLGGGADPVKEFLGAWQGVAEKKGEIKTKAKRTRSVTLTETTETEAAQPAASGEVIDATPAEWSADELDTLALPPPREAPDA